ncbi:MAG: sigma-70 family RNA polymerase sigma factor [Armatimonadetes bacterium]|nr:sigma-70 family RNA polymerase sigma factor [Armatimonadota bacterium]
MERTLLNQKTSGSGWSAPMNGEKTVATDEDGTLIARFLSGDATAFDTLFRKYQDYVYHILYGIVGSAEEARDLTQDVFLQVYRSLPRFRHNARFATWLYRIAVNRGVDAARGAKRWRFLPLVQDNSAKEQSADEMTEPEFAFEKQMEQKFIQDTLQRCPLSHRDILVLRYYRDMSLEEIAETLDCSLAAAKVRLYRARKVFKEQYETLYGAPTVTARTKEDADATQAVR